MPSKVNSKNDFGVNLPILATKVSKEAGMYIL